MQQLNKDPSAKIYNEADRQSMPKVQPGGSRASYPSLTPHDDPFQTPIDEPMGDLTKMSKA